MTRPLSIVIPAHNEEAVIGRCLRAVTAGAAVGELDIVVVCNGCDDRTATEAAAAWPEARVIDLPSPGKAAALNTGDRAARHYPRFYLDADIEVGIGALRAVAGVLDDGTALCAAPRPEFDLEDRAWAVRAYYRVWQELPYLRGAVVGSGLYALSREGRERFGSFPEITADDQFVMQQFADGERRSIPGSTFRIHTPRRLSGLYRMRRRVYRGNRELAASGLAREALSGRPWPTLAALARRPTWWPALVVYLGLNTVSDLAGRRASPANGWERDDSARQPSPTGPPGDTPAVGYVTSRYPSISHTFVLREVQAVRRAGLDVTPFSVRRAEEADLLSEQDREEAAKTWSIRPLPIPRLIGAHLRVLVRRPGAWLDVLRFAVRRSPPGVRSPLWQAFYFAQAVVLYNEAQRRGIRHLHAHMANVAADTAWLATELGRRTEPGRGWRWSFTMHGPTELFDTSRYNLAAKTDAADLVLCISDFARSQMMSLIGPERWDKLQVVHMGADLARYQPPGRRVASGEALRILSVGRLAPVKGQGVLLEAVAVLRERGHRVHLTLVGDGPLSGTLAGRVTALGLDDVVNLAGAIGQDALPVLYAEADVFCMASFAEGVPVVLMEAMATGLPVVATTINGIPELIDDGRSGLLVPPGRADLLADALERLVDPGLRRSLGDAGLETVRKHFDAELCAVEVVEAFAKLSRQTG